VREWVVQRGKHELVKGWEVDQRRDSLCGPATVKQKKREKRVGERIKDTTSVRYSTVQVRDSKTDPTAPHSPFYRLRQPVKPKPSDPI
jgi:hypothetical protein